MPHQRYNFWLFVCVLFTSWLIRRRRRRRRQHVHTFPGILEAFDFWSTFNLTGCVSELRLVTLSDLSFFLFFVLLLLYSFFVLLIKHKKKYHQIKLCFRTSYFRAPDKCIACPFQLHDKCATRWGRRVRGRERGREGAEREGVWAAGTHRELTGFYIYFHICFHFGKELSPRALWEVCCHLPLPSSLSLCPALPVCYFCCGITTTYGKCFVIFEANQNKQKSSIKIHFQNLKKKCKQCKEIAKDLEQHLCATCDSKETQWTARRGTGAEGARETTTTTTATRIAWNEIQINRICFYLANSIIRD